MPIEELPGVTGKGVERLKIKKIDNAIAKYEAAKEKRCKASPDEIASKQALQKVMHEHIDQLPKNEEGLPYYRSDEDVDFILEESIKRRKAPSSDGDE